MLQSVLCFPPWHMAPRVVASLVSYEAERRTMRAAHPSVQFAAEQKSLLPPPDDLLHVLALTASADPATASLRAFARASRSDPAIGLELRDTAATTGRAFMTLFNHAEVIEAVRTEFGSGPYWECVLQYAHAGGLQAVLDEYAHLLRESLAVESLAPAAMADKIGTEIISTLTIRTASLRIDNVTAPRYARELKLQSEPMRIRFAMRFGDDRADEEALPTNDGSSPSSRKERVRAAFNSPLLALRFGFNLGRAGGLDFHHYCHSITHWNLPSNPVDREQREGRIHRYKGHAVRKNVAAMFDFEALKNSDPDAWETLFEMGRDIRLSGENDIVLIGYFRGTQRSSGTSRHCPSAANWTDCQRCAVLLPSTGWYLVRVARKTSSAICLLRYRTRNWK